MSPDPDTTPPHVRDRVRLEIIEHRLQDGAKTFETLRQSIEALKPKPAPTWEMPLKLFGVAVVLAAAFIAVGEYRANSRHVAESVNETRQELYGVKSEVRALDTSVREVKTAVEGIKAQVKAATAPAADPITGRRRPRR